jgi:V/A-type H+-transporting ATPase subunit A
MIGAVSPPGGDISEPVSQATLRITKVFLALDAGLAHRRHYPAINWLKSYSLYGENLTRWFEDNVAADYMELRGRALALMQKEAELQDIVKLVGADTLPDKERAILKVAQMLKEDFLQQNSFETTDAHTSFLKQRMMLNAIMAFHEGAQRALGRGVLFDAILRMGCMKAIASMKRAPEETIGDMRRLVDEMNAEFAQLAGGAND